jgi:hypothetical protein
LAAVVVLAVGTNLGGVHSPQLHTQLIAIALAAGFAVLGVVGTRNAANGLARAATRTSSGGGTATRLLGALAGYLVVAGGTLGLLAVPWSNISSSAVLSPG